MIISMKSLSMQLINWNCSQNNLGECYIGELVEAEFMLFPIEAQLLTLHNPGRCHCCDTHSIADE